MSWNIHRCRGPDGVCDADRVLRVVDRVAPDVLAVQEVETRATGRDGRNILALLADAVGEHRAAAYTLVEADGRYGQAGFSRLAMPDQATPDMSLGETGQAS